MKNLLSKLCTAAMSAAVMAAIAVTSTPSDASSLNNPYVPRVSTTTVSLKHKVVGKYVHGNDSGQLEASKKGIGTSGVFEQISIEDGLVAFRCISNSQILIIADGPSYAALCSGGDTVDSDREKFKMEWSNLEGGGWAIKNQWSNRYLQAENSVNFPLRSISDGINTWEIFWPEAAYDMWTALNAFHYNFPNKVKTSDSGWAVVGKDTIKDGSSWWYILYADYRFHEWGHPAWDRMGLAWIDDWEYIVIQETQEQFQASPAWPSGTPRMKRYWHAHTAAQNPNPEPTHRQEVKWQMLRTDCGRTQKQKANEWYTVYPSSIVDLGNSSSQESMGKRWVVWFGYKDGHEKWALDLGPAEHVFQPRYGIVYYGNNITEAYFTNIQDDQKILPRRCP
ncbi:MAG: hypothetical protein M3Q07_09175 [Pseudobdellovibrionaceae bacterium]|nr:hypothetical protein [Pseudobdellovibrionaceae bacterium]